MLKLNTMPGQGRLLYVATKKMFHGVIAHLLQTIHFDGGLRSARQPPLAVAPRECHTCVDSPDEQQREEGMFPQLLKRERRRGNVKESRSRRRSL